MTIVIVTVYVYNGTCKGVSTDRTSAPGGNVLLTVMTKLTVVFFCNLIMGSLSPRCMANNAKALAPCANMFYFTTNILVAAPIFGAFTVDRPTRKGGIAVGSCLGNSAHARLVNVLKNFV